MWQSEIGPSFLGRCGGHTSATIGEVHLKLMKGSTEPQTGLSANPSPPIHRNMHGTVRIIRYKADTAYWDGPGSFRTRETRGPPKLCSRGKDRTGRIELPVFYFPNCFTHSTTPCHRCFQISIPQTHEYTRKIWPHQFQITFGYRTVQE